MMAEDERDTAPPDSSVSLYGSALEAGALVGPWVVEARVHPGITAYLYRATHVVTRVPAALKVLHPELNHVTEVLRRFKQEAETLQRLDHPNIVRILEHGELRDGRPWLAMEWLEGEDVESWLAHRGAFSVEEMGTVMEELGSALRLAHDVGVLHRDLKARNVMLLPRPEGFTVKLVDFGIAKVQVPDEGAGLTSAGAVLGTPVAMAPEQILGQPVDVRTDVYALGVLLYQLLTGSPPFPGTSAVEVEEQHLHAPPPRLGEHVRVPADLESVLQRCLAKRPEERWPDVDAFLGALRASLTRQDGASWAQGLYVDLRFPAGEDDPTDEALDARDAALDDVRAALESSDWGLAVEGGNALLAWRPLPGDPVGREREARSGRAQADRMLARVLERVGARVEARFYVCAAPSDFSREGAGPPRLEGGPLLRLEQWATGGAAGAVTEREPR
ncbi:serine/threonine protein kinase [Myxococcus sp. K15C18031901]|uniref:serine/threonine-protein kinase n=1 Tax=Myxococcus dinghuensis TaxID=2906761 RepID=UPI0020A7EFD6|nr:serine/threonine-protein kinase [Myxococcus dinghuensis]MCP3103525.1 serine/threonine protein kinase [Myxococcus dinghuensis]